MQNKFSHSLTAPVELNSSTVQKSKASPSTKAILFIVLSREIKKKSYIVVVYNSKEQTFSFLKQRMGTYQEMIKSKQDQKTGRISTKSISFMIGI